jgi:DNA-binding transcriptional ArsR family regulator
MREISMFDWEKLVASTIHPAKVAIIEALRWTEQPLSATELSEILKEGGFSFDGIHYHLRGLVKVGAVTEASSRTVRGARERFFLLSVSREPVESGHPVKFGTTTTVEI